MRTLLADGSVLVSKMRTGAWPKNGISEACPGPDSTQYLLQCPSDFEKVEIASLSPLFPGKGREQCACLHTQRERRALKLHFPLFDLDVLIPAHTQRRNEEIPKHLPTIPFPPLRPAPGAWARASVHFRNNFKSRTYGWIYARLPKANPE